MTPKERARNYVWSRIEAADRNIYELERNIEYHDLAASKIKISEDEYDELHNAYKAAVSRRVMFNYLFKLIELDED